MTIDELVAATKEFAASTTDLVNSCLSGDDVIPETAVSTDAKRASFKLVKDLYLEKQDLKLARLQVSFRMQENSTGNHLAVDASSFQILAYRHKKPVPLVRFEYERDARSKPASHIHLHSESVPIGVILASSDRREIAIDQHDLHYPAGDARYRVCLEDVIEFAIVEFGFRAEEGWEDIVQRGRSDFYERQTDAVILHHLDRAAELLRAKGYVVSKP